MKIEFSAPKQVRITWPPYDDAAIESQIVERLKTVPGIEGFGRRWYAPVIQLWRLTELFPRASFDYAAMSAADKVAATFYQNTIQRGMGFTIDLVGDIRAVGDGVSPLFQQLVDDRAHALRPLVVDAMKNPQPVRHWPVVMDRGIDLLAKGIRNAQKQAADEAVRYPKRRRAKKIERVA